MNIIFFHYIGGKKTDIRFSSFKFGSNQNKVSIINYKLRGVYSIEILKNYFVIKKSYRFCRF